jgi:hypothetical protein
MSVEVITKTDAPSHKASGGKPPLYESVIYTLNQERSDSTGVLSLPRAGLFQQIRDDRVFDLVDRP